MSLSSFWNGPGMIERVQTESNVAAAWRYWAFISYSHSDEAFATWLHHKLETYTVPRALVGRPHPLGGVPRRLKPIFRDRDDLPGSSDLGSKIRGALEASRYLIVICSPKSAKSKYVDEEIRYFKSLGRSRRVLAIILEGKPNAGPNGRAQDECFAPSLTSEMDDTGKLTGRRADPLAADARPAGDGRHRAVLKTIAGLLEVGFDDLYQRERRRQRFARMRRIAMVFAAAIAVCLGYGLLSDAKINLPAGDKIRTWLDRHGIIVFRPIHSEAAVAEKAAQLRRRLVTALWERKDPHGLAYYPGSIDRPDKFDPWTSSQLLAGLSATPELSADQVTELQGSLRRLVDETLVVDEQGAPLGWRFRPGHPPLGAITAWLAQAAAIQHGRRAPPDANGAVESASVFRRITSIAEVHAASDGDGWFMYPSEADLKTRNNYVSILMLQALISAHEARMDWRPDPSRDERIRTTVKYLLASYRNGGWRRTNTDHDTATYDGMTLQGYCALLRAERIGAAEIPPEMMKNLTAHLIACADRPIDYQGTSAEFEYLVRDQGKTSSFTETVHFLWYPWAVQAATLWLERPETAVAPPEHVVGVRRALGHMVMELGDETIDQAVNPPLHFAGEVLFGLSAISPPPSGQE
jgi:hypothetical protein